MPRVAVIGHVEWVDFIEVEHFPQPGDLLEVQSSFARAGGGGGVAAAVLRELGADVDFFLALGRDAQGEAALEQLQERGIDAHVAWRQEPTRRAVTLLQPGGERTIITIGKRLEPRGDDRLPWERLKQADGVYFTAGDAGALAHGREARVLVATPRGRAALAEGAPPLDALIYSADDPSETEAAEKLAARTRLLLDTRGDRGGGWQGEEEGTWEASEPPGEPKDAYGCGDSFAAGFTFGLADGGTVVQAVRVGADCGARLLTRTGAP